MSAEAPGLRVAPRGSAPGDVAGGSKEGRSAPAFPLRRRRFPRLGYFPRPGGGGFFSGSATAAEAPQQKDGAGRRGTEEFPRPEVGPRAAVVEDPAAPS